MNAPGRARAAVIAVGTELVADGRADGNGVSIGRLLAGLGIDVALRMQVPDEEEELARALDETSLHHPLVIVTGGLGPTMDDVTREAAARAFHLTLEEDAGVLKAIDERLRSRGRALSPAARRQALVPRGARVLANSAGTAPGLWLELPGRGRIFFLPGVPHEMQTMMFEQVVPRLADLCRPPRALCGLKVGGLSEVQVQERLERALGADQVAVTILASPGEVSVILRADEPRVLDPLVARVKAQLGEHFLGDDLQAGIEDVVGALLRARGMTLATAESCTAGLLGALITRVSGSSAWYRQGWITYADEAKITQLGVPAETLREHGAVSEPVAAIMASEARARSGASWGISITGVAGPTGGSESKPVGLVFIGLAGDGETRVTRHLFPGDRETIRLFAARTALHRLWQALSAGSDRS